MNSLTKTLLGGVALAVLVSAPAFASKLHGMHVTAMHAGKQVNKTKFRQCPVTVHHCDYTFVVYSYQPASAPPKTRLPGTFYKWNSNGDICSSPKQHVKAPKKSVYAKIGTASQTYSIGCSNGPTTFYGDLWTNKTGVAGNVDTFVSALKGTFYNGGNKYKGELDINVQVTIE